MKMKVKWNLLLVLALLHGVAAYCFPQPVAAATGSVDFIFTSSPNPSAYTQKVTFTLSTEVTGEIDLPYGWVEFLDNGTPIEGCEAVYLNFNSTEGSIEAIPAVCETSTLAVDEDEHTITAIFNSYDSTYENATFTLGQKVNEPFPLTISPETLPDGEYGMMADQHFTATYSDSTVCGEEDCEWAYSGDFPDSVAVAYYGGILGQVNEVGTFTFTVTAGDGNGALGSRQYTWTIQKSTPKVTVEDQVTSRSYYGATIYANVSHATNPNSIPPGTLSFYLDGEPIDSCTELPGNEYGRFGCDAFFDAPLDPGDYEVTAEFTPDETASEYYNNGSGSATLTVASDVQVQLFHDLDRDGVRDPTESPPGGWWLISLDKDCDGSNEDVHNITDYSGYHSFTAILPDNQYCLSVDLGEYWRQSTPMEPFTMGWEDQYFEIGVYIPHLEFDPLELPPGTVGEAYNQVITITGGVEPYSITDLYVSLPDGLTFDPETFTLSGTPTTVWYGYLSFYVEDAEGVTDQWDTGIEILTHGSYELTANPIPSASGQAVTFTFTGSGEFVDPEYGPVPPYGDVTFFDGDTVIAGCEALPLNYDPDEYEWIDQPAMCTTSSLAEGLHAIRAEFDSFWGYHDEVLTLNYLVEANSSPTIIFLPLIQQP